MQTSNNAQRERLWQLLGDLPPRDRRLGVKVLGSEQCEHYILEKLLLDLNGIEGVPAYFTRPLNPTGPTPAVLYHHAHGGDYALGKDEFIRGRDLLQNPPYAEFLAREGYAGLCIDSWVFGERSGRTESSVFKDLLWHGHVLWGMMVYDAIRALDYLCSRTDVNAARIATTGLSMGSTMAWWCAALDERIRVCVDLCCLTDYQALLDDNGLDRHGLYYYVPGLLKDFSTASINALIAPRPHLSLVGTQDTLTPLIGVHRVDSALKQAYERAGARDAWQVITYPCGHGETPEMRQDVIAWLRRWL